MISEEEGGKKNYRRGDIRSTRHQMISSSGHRFITNRTLPIYFSTGYYTDTLIDERRNDESKGFFRFPILGGRRQRKSSISSIRRIFYRMHVHARTCGCKYLVYI